jgi:hypothetical protein
MNDATPSTTVDENAPDGSCYTYNAQYCTGSGASQPYAIAHPQMVIKCNAPSKPKPNAH